MLDKYSMERPTCNECRKNLCAINYRKNDQIYYRKFCDPCLRKRVKKNTPSWITLGYKKKNSCESCGFVSKINEQLTVVEYNKSFKTVCLNCEAEFLTYKRLVIKKGDLKPDF